MSPKCPPNPKKILISPATPFYRYTKLSMPSIAMHQVGASVKSVAKAKCRSLGRYLKFYITIRPGGHTTTKTSLQGEPAVQPRGTLGQLERQWGPGWEREGEKGRQVGKRRRKVGKD